MQPTIHSRLRLTLQADTAADLMTKNPVSIRSNVRVAEALGVMIDRAVTAAPVIDADGRPVGVVSVTDILANRREAAEAGTLIPVGPAALLYHDAFESCDATTVGEVMTAGVIAVPAAYPAEAVVEDLLRRRVHHLFVYDPQGVIVGVISAPDVLRHLAR